MFGRDLDRVIVVEDNEFSIKSAQKESQKATKKGHRVVFDLRNIKDRKRKTELTSLLSTIDRMIK
ncbi:hypothetical protein J2S74_000818 [Evansella vedderi]|uniref:Uncharacterized protein n=1 Tax=Evansella vedderi TaxID=38282 RepID=A0ABT9ZQC7_9BACI|nr:hypothetical protein [Evansella vedderi]MDQ0253446.1 hypothetical protein [Evansella vedderi]